MFYSIHLSSPPFQFILKRSSYMQCVSLFFLCWRFSLDNSSDKCTAEYRGEKKDRVVVWEKQTAKVMLDTSITLTPPSSVFNHDACKWHNSQMNISKTAITQQKGQEKGQKEKCSFGKCRSPAELLKTSPRGKCFGVLIVGLIVRNVAV